MRHADALDGKFRASSRAAGIVGQRPDAPDIVEDNSDRRFPLDSIGLQAPGVASGAVCVALGWTRGGLLSPSGEPSPTGIKAPGSGKGDAVYDTAKRLLREAAAKRLWTKSSGSGWVWWNYIPLEGSETDLDSAFCANAPYAHRLLRLLEDRGWTGWTMVRRIPGTPNR